MYLQTQIQPVQTISKKIYIFITLFNHLLIIKNSADFIPIIFHKIKHITSKTKKIQ